MYSRIFAIALTSIFILTSCEGDSINPEENPIENPQGINENESGENGQETPNATESEEENPQGINENESGENGQETPNATDSEEETPNDTSGNINPEEETPEETPVIELEEEIEVNNMPSNNLGNEVTVRNGTLLISIGASTIGPNQSFSFTTGDGVSDFIPNFTTSASITLGLPNFTNQWAVFNAITGNIITITNSLNELKAVDFDTLIPASETSVFRVFNILYENGILENFEVGQSIRDLRASEPNKASISNNQLRLLVNIN